MPEMLSLEVEPREVVGKKVKALRRDGIVPGVVYGHRAEVRAVQVDEHTLGRFLSRASASSLIEVAIRGEDAPRPAIIRDVQRHVLTQRVEHIDFLQVDLTERVRISVPLVLVGEAPAALPQAAVGDEEAPPPGVVIQGLDALEVECLPTDIPTEIEVDVTSLAHLNDSIHVRDLAVPEGVEVITPAEAMVARVVAERPEEEEEVGEGLLPELEEVEVISADRAEARHAQRAGAQAREKGEEED
ncbi:MAG: 50S ribosomal protein L25 [Anaerolineae bacterium]|nr:50S ribosomal protein L25 [Anaerolineae bacterium]